MSYFSNTGSTITHSKRNQSTAKDSAADLVSKGVVFHIVDKTRQFTNRVDSDYIDSSKEEVSKEEEDRFYKKVFRTSLI
jgi:hypothetical protein